MKKRLICWLMVFLLVFSLFTVAQEDISEGSCSGFWGSISCFLWGNPENRAGAAWFDRGNVVGEAGEVYNQNLGVLEVDGLRYVRGRDPILYKEKYYYVFTAGDDEAFIYYDNSWKQVNVQNLNAPVSKRTLSFVTASNQPTDDPNNADTSSGLKDVRVDDNIVTRSASPPVAAPPASAAPSIIINGETYVAASTKVSSLHFNFDYTAYITPDGQKSMIYFDGKWRRVGMKDDKLVFVDASGNQAAQSSQAETFDLPKPGAIPGALTVTPVHPATEIPEQLRTGLKEGDVIKSKTGAEFEVRGEKFIQIKGAKGDVGDVLVLTPEKLAELFKNENYQPGIRFTVIPSAQRVEETRKILGETVYSQVEKEINWAASSGNNYVLNNELRTVSVDEKNGITSVTMEIKGTDIKTIDEEKSQTIIISDGQEIISQTYAQEEKGFATLPKYTGATDEVFVGKDGFDITTGSYTYYENEQAFKDRDPLGSQELAGGQIVNTNFQQESQVIIDTKTNQQQVLNGDYYPREESSGCGDNFKTAGGGCFLPSGGLLTVDGERYVTDVDYDTTFGADRELVQTELFNFHSGRREGIRESDGTIIVAVKDQQGKYTGEKQIITPDGQRITARKEGDGFVPLVLSGINSRIESLQSDIKGARAQNDVREIADLEKQLAQLQQEKKEYDLEKRTKEVSQQQQHMKEIDSSTVGGIAIAQTTIESVYALTQSVKDYPALSRLFGLPTGDNFLFDADRTFAPLLGSNWFPSAICEAHYDIEPEGFAMIKTVSGTYQAVAGIQMERSASTSPILCQRNPDQEAEELFICDRGYVCVNEGFCHVDTDEDGEADTEQPAVGYFYKITWGVTAPRDEAFTPLLDENGVAVSFNIWLDQTPNDVVNQENGVFMYSRQGDITSPIQLRNGAADQDVIIHYSPNLYEEACIKWNQVPSTIMGEVTGDRTIDDVCFQVDVSSVGEVNWQRSGQAPSVTVQSGEVQRNSGW